MRLRITFDLKNTDSCKWQVRPDLSYIFDVHGSVHRNNILVYKSQQDAHIIEFI
jgi:hypothetical protein